jgi:serine/threonine protein kinase
MAGLATILSSSNTRGGIKKNTDSNSHEVRAKNRLRGFFHQQLKSESNVMFTSPYESRNNSRHSAVALPDIKEENISGATDSPNSSSHEDPILQKVIQVQAALDTLDHNSEHSISNTLHLRHSFASTPNLQRSSDPLPLRKSLRSLTLSKTEEDDEESRGQLSTQRSRINLQKEGSLQGSPRRGSLNKNIRRSRQTPAIGDDSPALKKVQRRSVMRDFRSSSEAILDTVQRERKRRQSFAESQNSKGHSSLTLLHLERATAMSTRDNTFSFQGKELSPSSTFHFRPKLEEALEKQRQMQEANKRAALVAMGLSVSTLGQDASLHAEEELPFEFEPDKEELDRQEQINVAVAKMDAYSDVLQDEDPFLTACQVAKQQYAQDFEYSRIQDLSHKFPLFDLDEINQGLVLGTGSFAQVIEVKGFCLKPAGVATASGKNNFTTSMRQKRRVMAGMEDQDGQSESSYEIAPLKGDNEGDNEDGASAIEGSKDGYGIGDITDDELEIADDGDDFNAASEAVDVVAQGLSNRSLFQQCRQQNKTLKKSQSSMDSSRQFIADHCHRAKEGEPSRSNARYALKQLKRKIKDDPHTMMQGIADMATETRVLSSLTEHPNLIKLRGIARGSGMPFQCDYFILLDRLYDTLSIRLQRWMHMEKQLGGVKGMLWDPKGIQRKQLWNDRVSFAFDLSSALAYLHSRHVMHRDLKPDNIGFDIRGDIKIFDFGLAKELPTVNNGGRNKFHFTAMCGSPRYVSLLRVALSI